MNYLRSQNTNNDSLSAPPGNEIVDNKTDVIFVTEDKVLSESEEERAEIVKLPIAAENTAKVDYDHIWIDSSELIKGNTANAHSEDEPEKILLPIVKTHIVPEERAQNSIIKAEVTEEPDRIKTVDAVVAYNENPMYATSSVASMPMHLLPAWRPQLPNSLTARNLYYWALCTSNTDPARQILGFFYEAQLKRECKALVPYPIPSYCLVGIWKALWTRRNNPEFFICQAIDIVLVNYLNSLTNGGNNGLFLS